MNDKNFLFKNVSDDVKVFLLDFLDSGTKQNLFVHFNDVFYNCYYGILLSKLQYFILKKENNISKNIIFKNNSLNNNVKHMMYLNQNGYFGNLLLEMQNLLEINSNLYNQFEQIIFEFYICRLSNPYINSLITNDKKVEIPFSLINTQTLDWIIRNKNANNLSTKYFDLVKYGANNSYPISVPCYPISVKKEPIRHDDKLKTKNNKKNLIDTFRFVIFCDDNKYNKINF